MDAFCGVNCPTLKKQTAQAGNRCTIKPSVKEEIDGCKLLLGSVRTDYMLTFTGLTELPGGVKVKNPPTV
jgi:hypothetical protein